MNSTTKKTSSRPPEALKKKLKEQARFCKAARIARVPRVVTKLILQYLPEFEIKKEDLRMFPEAITADAIQVLDGSGSRRDLAIRFFS